MTSIDLDVKNFSKKEGSGNKTHEIDEDTLSVYDEKELSYLDKYLTIEDELYQIILNCDFNDDKIEKTINDRLKYLNAKGLDYGWNVIDKNKRKKPIDFSQIVKADEISKEEKNKKQKKEEKKKKQNKNKQKSENFVKDRVSYQDNTYGYDIQYYGYDYYESDYYQQKGENYSNNYSDYTTWHNRQYSNYTPSKRANQYYNNYNDYNNYYSYDNKDYYSSYYNYYDNYYYNQGYYDDKQGTKSFKRKKRPTTEKYNTRSNKNYYDNNHFEYSTKYDKNNKNFRVIIKDLDDDEQIIRNKLVIQPKDASDIGLDSNLESHVKTEEKVNEIYPIIEVSKNILEINDEIEDNFSSIKQNENMIQVQNQNVENVEDNQEKNANGNSADIVDSSAKTSGNVLVNTETSNEIEEINVNKVDIENLRSYFDKFKHFTIFNETVQPSMSNIPDKKSSKPFYDQFNNFKASSAMIKSFMNSHNASTNIFEKETDKDSEKKYAGFSDETSLTTDSKSKKPNTLTINNNHVLEITSSSSKNESDIEDKKIYNFSLFISGTEKTKKIEEPTINKTPSQENKTIISHQPMTQTTTQPLNPTISQPLNLATPNLQSQIPSNYMYYPNYTNMVTSQPINSYMPYEQPGFMNMPNRMNFAESGNYNPEFIGNNPTDPYQPYEYAQYQYYGMPYRFNNIQYPGYQNFQYGGYPSGYMDRYAYMNPNVQDYNYNTFPNYPINPNPNVNYNPYNEQQKRK